LIICASTRLADNRIIYTSSLRIAVGDGTCRSLRASNRSRNDSETCIASVGDTLSWRFCCNQLSRNVGEDTISGASVAAINSADALIVTDCSNVYTDSTCKIARVGGTCVVIVTVDRRVDTVSSV